MGKMTKLSSIFKPKDSKKPWQWAACNHPKTLSFRAQNDDIFKTVNSIFFDPSYGVETTESWFTNSSESASASYSTESDRPELEGEPLEMVVRGARSERLFFEPEKTSSITEKTKQKEREKEEMKYREVTMESENPYEDFRRSMEEMVEKNGVKEWEGLEELLGWYLKVNGKKNHGFIVGAFVDVLVDIFVVSSSSSSRDSAYYSCCMDSSSSLFSALSLRSPERSVRQEIDEEEVKSV